VVIEAVKSYLGKSTPLGWIWLCHNDFKS